MTDEIKRLVVTCGAAFEERDIAICTHMITSHRYVEEPGGSSLKGNVSFLFLTLYQKSLY